MLQCTATNTLGRDVALVELRQKGELAGCAAHRIQTNAWRDCICNLEKRILPFVRKHFNIWTNTSYNFYKYISEGHFFGWTLSKRWLHRGLKQNNAIKFTSAQRIKTKESKCMEGLPWQWRQKQVLRLWIKRFNHTTPHLVRQNMLSLKMTLFS